jgi:hypothetical protein
MLTWLQILLAFFITACTAVILSLIAYIGGLLPSHHLRRVDRRIFRANSRNQDSRWREIVEKIMMSVSDQQLVTGLAILVAGYYEMMNNNLSVYHWQIVVNLAWLSSAVHIASLTVLRDVLNKNPTLRNLRVAGMLALLALLAVAMWPIRFAAYLTADEKGMPVRCLWKPGLGPESLDSPVDPNWVLTITMLLSAYVWKLSQLFASSRGFVRRWLVAKPEAAIERLMRRAALSHRPWRQRWLTALYIHFVTYAEVAESFAASIVYLCLALPYGITLIISTRLSMDDEVIAGERRLTFGQLVPLFLLILPILQVLELSLGMCAASVTITKTMCANSQQDSGEKVEKKPGAIYSLVQSGHTPTSQVRYPDMASALRLNEPSSSDDKMQNDSAGSCDPIVDHLMSSNAFKSVVWFFFAALMGVGLTVIGMNIGSMGSFYTNDWRVEILLYVGTPVILGIVPAITMFVLPFSRRLR